MLNPFGTGKCFKHKPPFKQKEMPFVLIPSEQGNVSNAIDEATEAAADVLIPSEQGNVSNRYTSVMCINS